MLSAREQLERQREFEPDSGPYAYSGDRFRVDPGRGDDPILDALLAFTRPRDTWLDIGSGVGRYALPLARHVRRVVALEPEAEALAILEQDAERADIEGIETLVSGWPMDGGTPPRVDGALMAHVGYGVEDIGVFLDAIESAASRVCVAVMGEGPMPIVPRLLWRAVHDEERVVTPALPELISVLSSRGVPPTLAYAPRQPVTRSSPDGLVEIARRQLWVRAGSAKDERLTDAVRAMATQRDGRWALEWSMTRIGIASWEPAGAIS